MTTATKFIHHLLSSTARGSFIIVCGALLLLWPALANAQEEKPNVQYTDNKADQTLRSNARINPSTLAMELAIPLGSYPGRAGNNLPLVFNYSSKVWQITATTTWWSDHESAITDTFPQYAKRTAAGWVSSLGTPRIDYSVEIYDDEGKPWKPTSVGSAPPPPNYPMPSLHYIKRIRVHLPDGSTHELRKDDTVHPYDNNGAGADFSGTFFAVDGSRLRLELGGHESILYLSDGARYFFGPRPSNPSDFHLASSFIDRHGNQMSYNAERKEWTDTMGRVISDPLPLNETSQQQQAGTQSFQLPGMAGGLPLTFTLTWQYLKDPNDVSKSALADPNQVLAFTSDVNCINNQNRGVSPSLFKSDTYTRVCVGRTLPATHFNPVVLAQITLPNGSSYKFKYNLYGEIERIEYPTGGYEEFRYGKVDAVSWMERTYAQSNRGVVERWISVKGDGTDTADTHWHYSASFDQSTKVLTAVTTAPDGTQSERKLHGGYTQIGEGPSFGFDNVLAGMPYDERTYSAPDANNNRKMLRRTLTAYEDTPALPGGHIGATRNPRVAKSVELILDTGGGVALASTTTMAYDGDLNVTSTSKYDFVSVSNGETVAISSFPDPNVPPVRTDETTYLVNDQNIPQATRDAYRARNLTGLPSSSRVKSGNTIVAQSEIKYDEAAYPILSYGAVTDWTDPGATTVRGNATTTRSWLNTSRTWIETHAQYDQVGNIRKSWDGRDDKTDAERVTQVEYDVAYRYAYPTKTTSPVPDPSGVYGANTALVTTTVYDFSTGRVTFTKDANGQVNRLSTAYEYNDVMGRLTKVISPDGGSTEYIYKDTVGDFYVRTLTAINAAQSVESRQYFNGLGRSVRSFLYDGTDSTPWSVTDTYYDALGRVSKVSNPYRVAEPTASVPATCVACTMSTYDALGRVSTVTTPDGAVVTTAYSGNEVTVTDQAGKKRKSITDGLGRLRQVVEAPDIATCQTDGAGCATNYTYDVLGNLRKVKQGGQLRYFMYDSLSRLIRAKNPEQKVNASLALQDSFKAPDDDHPNSDWTLKYTYDNNGNLATKTDARGVTATYSYDALNRVTTTSYSDGTTPYAGRVYDKAVNGRGRFAWNWTHASAHTAVHEYDAVGRVKAQSQYFWINNGWGQAYTTKRDYDLMGHVIEQTYPSGHKVYYPQYDAAGRLKKFTGNLGDGTQRTYATGVNPVNGVEEGIQYDEAGRLTQERFGTQTPLYHKQQFNTRGQLHDIRLGLGSDIWSTERGVITINYGATINNGNVVFQKNWIPTNESATAWDIRQTNYAYDKLNRVTGMQEFYGTPGLVAQQVYTYDRWGNRQINAAGTTDTLNEKQFSIDTATNRLGVPGGRLGTMTYDNAGNLTDDTYTGAGARIYDAENRMTRAAVPSTNYSESVYTYDADGKRVRRQTPSENVWQVYGIDGELLAEYAANASYTQPQKEYGYRNGELLIVAEARSSAPSASGSITAGPNPIQVCDGSGVGVTTLSWSTTGATEVEVRVNAPNGTLFATTGPTGSWTTGKWVNNGMVFYLQNASYGDRTSAANTLATVTVATTTGGCQVASATFLSRDTTTQGNWKGKYGTQGYMLAGDGTSYPAYTQVSPTGHQNYTWAERTKDVRALQKSAADYRIAATWFSATSYTFDLNQPAGQTQQVALYALDWDQNNARAQKVEIIDVATNAVLDTREMSAFTNGQYVVWNLRGRVKIRVSNTGPAGLNAVTSALFFDAPASTVAAAATFLRSDTTTQGNWKGKYGAQGYMLAGDGTSYPAYAPQVSPTGHQNYTWADTTLDVRALEKVGTSPPDQKSDSSKERIAATWFSSTNYTFDLNLTDGQEHQVALYCLDWDQNNGRAQRVEVLDAATNVVLGSHDVASFSGGQYVVWSLRGHVKIKVSNTAPTGLNAVTSALFFDGAGTAQATTAAAPTQTTATAQATAAAAPTQTTTTNGVVQWLVSDHLGTPRMIADQTGSLAGIRRHDYLPFGEEVGAGIGGRTSGQGYAGDNVRKQFTGYERDDETGLDFAQRRYYSSAMGRFTSPDEPFMDQWEGNPQSWNLYSYVRNNPLGFIDPLGGQAQDPKKPGQCGTTGDTIVDSCAELEKNRKEIDFGEDLVVIDAVCATCGENAPEPKPKTFLEETVEGMYGAAEFAGVDDPTFYLMPGRSAASGLILGSTRAGVSSTGIKNVGKVVIGHLDYPGYPGYVETANRIGGRRFGIPEHIWIKMSRAEQWAANKKFLDRAIMRGDNFILATPLREGDSVFRQELNYLHSKGYRPNKDFTMLISPKRMA